MIDIIEKYLTTSKKNLFNISKYLEANIEFLENKLWTSSNEYEEIIKNIIDIYYDKYYIYPSNDWKKINDNIIFNNKINRKLKQFLMSIIEYYENKNKIIIIKQEEASILYITILLFVSDKLYNSDIDKIDTPKKVEKVINNIIDNFAKIRFNKNKNLEKLINNIKEFIVTNNEFNRIINSFDSSISSNKYIRINSKNKIYKVLYEYDIEELNKFDGKDIKIVINNDSITTKLMNLSYDLSYITSFKLLDKGIDTILLFPVTKEYINSIEYTNNKINEYIKFVIDFDEIDNDYNFMNNIKKNNIDLYIEVNRNFVTNDYNMFKDVKNIIIPEEFLSLNEKYVEIWKDKNINFIIKNLGQKITEKELIEEMWR